MYDVTWRGRPTRASGPSPRFLGLAPHIPALCFLSLGQKVRTEKKTTSWEYEGHLETGGVPFPCAVETTVFASYGEGFSVGPGVDASKTEKLR